MAGETDATKKPKQGGIGKPWNWAGACACILATGVSLSLVLIVLGPLLQDRPFTEQGAQLVSTLAGAAVGALAAYLGLSRSQQQQFERTRETDDKPTSEEG
jgi:hypothetical protein